MACNCVHNQREIEAEKKSVEQLRELFIKRMTVDSETQDRRKRDFNQAIFNFNEDGSAYQVFCETDLDMVLQCFDDAVKDLRRTWCDVESCRRK